MTASHERRGEDHSQAAEGAAKTNLVEIIDNPSVSMPDRVVAGFAAFFPFSPEDRIITQGQYLANQEKNPHWVTQSESLRSLVQQIYDEARDANNTNSDKLTLEDFDSFLKIATQVAASKNKSGLAKFLTGLSGLADLLRPQKRKEILDRGKIGSSAISIVKENPEVPTPQEQRIAALKTLILTTNKELAKK